MGMDISASEMLDAICQSYLKCPSRKFKTTLLIIKVARYAKEQGNNPFLILRIPIPVNLLISLYAYSWGLIVQGISCTYYALPVKHW